MWGCWSIFRVEVCLLRGEENVLIIEFELFDECVYFVLFVGEVYFEVFFVEY